MKSEKHVISIDDLPLENITFQGYIHKNPPNLIAVITHERAFAREVVEDLDRYLMENFTPYKGRTGQDIKLEDSQIQDTNNRDIRYIHPTFSANVMKLYRDLFLLGEETNRNHFDFDIDHVSDLLHHVIYPEDSGHLTWHTDIGGKTVNCRKLAMTVQLSDPEEYEGGKFQIWTGGEEYNTLDLKKGDVCVFPAYLLHRVTPVTKGQRKVLVFWIGGRHFR